MEEDEEDDEEQRLPLQYLLHIIEYNLGLQVLLPFRSVIHLLWKCKFKVNFVLFHHHNSPCSGGESAAPRETSRWMGG